MLKFHYSDKAEDYPSKKKQDPSLKAQECKTNKKVVAEDDTQHAVKIELFPGVEQTSKLEGGVKKKKIPKAEPGNYK